MLTILFAIFALFSLAAFILIGLILLFIKLDQLYRRECIPNYNDKTVFITGTDTGFGRELALLLDRKGLVVYAGCYTEQGGDQLRKDASSKLRVLNIDVTKRETLEKAKDFIEKDLSPGEGLWGLVNNAGIIRGVVIDFCTVEDFRQTMEVNFFSAVTTTDVFLPLIKKARGRIVNVSSVMGRISTGVEPYTCSKHALEPYCDGMRRSMKPFGVHVAVIEPGYHTTNISSCESLASEVDRTWAKLPTHLKEEYGEEFKENVKSALVECISKIPGKGHPRNVAEMISHALSSKRPKARYVCGSDATIGIRVLPFVPDWFLDLVMCHIVMKYNTVFGRVN